MSVYRRKSSNSRDGRSRFYTVEIKRAGKPTFRKAGFTDKKSAKQFESDMRRRFERGEVGLLDAHADSKRRPLREHVRDYIAHMATMELDDMYVYTTERRILRVMEHAKWDRLGEVTIEGFERWRHHAAKTKWRGKKLKPKTLNQFVDTWQTFMGWLVDHNRLGDNPLKNLRKAKALDNPDYRRAATREEFERLLAAAPEERRRAYLFVIFTPGLRRAALETLKWADFEVTEDSGVFVTVKAEHNKIRKHQRFPVRYDVWQMLVKGLSNSRHVFPNFPTIDDLRADLKAAGVPFAREDGNGRLDLHAFRKTAQRWLEEAGVPLAEASKLLGHRNIQTTEKHYRERTSAKSEAIERLPGFNMGGNGNGVA